ncbi:MAG TPA: sulfatase-like hydrolase/transferase, partial [Candidatus Hydrogenedentes bacterium]|nr:sulfatase-like hydrolase/transferase [Candidatus Hydrogenedentota bacterium]
MRFENSFCPYPVCTPSRYSLLSGRYVHEHRGSNNHCTLAPDIATFPRLLRDAGYKTRSVGKMHFTPTYLDVGFEEMCLAEQDGPGRWDDDYHRALMREGLVDFNDLEDQRDEYRTRARQEYGDAFGALPSNLPEAWHTTTWIGDRAAEALEGWTGGGNLLMAGFVKPHHPFDPPKLWQDAYDPDKLTLLPGWTETCFEHDLNLHRGYFPHEKLTESALRRIMAYYYATIEQIDAQVGRMVAILKRKGLYDTTMILYTSDHGEYMGFHHMLLKGNHMYDPLAKVPLLIKYPESAPGIAGEKRRGISNALVTNLDVAPTVLFQAGIPPADIMRGNNLAAPGPEREMVFCECGRGRVMSRTRTHKLLLDQVRNEALFFDLEADPLEMKDLSSDRDNRAEMRRHRKAIKEWRPFEQMPEPYLDENAPVIDRPNVPPRDLSHRPGIIAYYEKRW